MGFDFILNVPLLSCCCGFFFVFKHTVSFPVDSGLFISGRSPVSYAFGVFMRSEPKSFYFLRKLSKA